MLATGLDPQVWAMLFGSGGVGAIALVLVKGLLEWVQGQHGREKQRNRDAISQRNDAYAERDAERDRANRERDRADREAKRRQQLSDYASELRRCLIEHGVQYTEIPAWPRSSYGGEDTQQT